MADLGKEFLNTIKKSDQKKTSAFDSVGTVTRVKDGVAYVHFAGGVDETPVKLTINAQAGDEVQVRVADGRAWLVGNATSPPTDDTQARRAINLGKQANDAAVKATKDAMVAHEAAESATRDAKTAKDLAESVEGIAQHAEEVAEGVEAIAESAKTAADTAFTNLSQVQRVLEVAEWIATHGTYTKATTFNPNATYYTITATQVASPSDDDKDSQGVLIYYELSSGVYARTTDTSVQSGKTYYTVTGTPVAGAKAEDIAQYYTLAVSDAMADYIQSHLALTDDGLWLIKDGSGYKFKLTNYGSYIVAPDGTTVVNQNTADGNIIRALDGTVIAHLGFGEGKSESGVAEAPYYSLGVRYEHPLHAIGNYSLIEGHNNVASGFASHAEGDGCIAQGHNSHAEGGGSEAIGNQSHAEGIETAANGEYSHAQNERTIAKKKAQTAIGTYNVEENSTTTTHPSGNVTYGKHLLIAGNGTDKNNRSNAFTVDWDGNVKAQGWAGFIQMFAGSTAPSGWLFCDGSEVAVADYPLLYAVIGNTYGTPSDSDHFLLPDFMGRTPVGVGQGTGLSNRTRGQKVGAETHKLTVNEMPNHRHKQVDTPWFQSNRAMSSGAYTLADVRTSNVYTEYTGGDQEHNNMQPSLGINFIICTGETS